MTLSEQSPRARIEKLIADLTWAREQVEDVDIPGWVIGHPSLSEINEDLVTMVARSKPGERVPFYPPTNTEVVITVLEGSVRIESGATATLVGRKFFVLTAAEEEHSIVPLTDNCKLFATFFRTGVTDGGEQSLAAR